METLLVKKPVPGGWQIKRLDEDTMKKALAEEMKKSPETAEEFQSALTMTCTADILGNVEDWRNEAESAEGPPRVPVQE